MAHDVIVDSSTGHKGITMEQQTRQTTKAHWLTVYQTFRVYGLATALQDTDYDGTQADLLDFFANLHNDTVWMPVRKLP